MSALDNLLPASYNGIPFFVETDSVQTGKLTTQHLYPFKTYSYIEELGKKLRSFSVSALVHGEDYELQRDALMAMLNVSGTGVLIHPYYGIVTVVCTGFKVNHDIQQAGVSYFDLSFEETQLGTYPAIAGISISSVLSLAKDAALLLKSAFNGTYKTMFPQNLKSSSEKCFNISAALSSNLAATSGVNRSNLNDFADNKTQFNQHVYSNVKNSDQLGTSLVDLLNSYNDIASDSSKAFDLNIKLFKFGSTDQYVRYDTLASHEKIINLNAINDIVNSIALINMYKNIMLMDGKSDDEMLMYISKTEDCYQYLLSASTLSNDLMLRLEDLRCLINKFLENNTAAGATTVDQYTQPIPLTALLYKYYENFDKEDDIITYNNIRDALVVNGAIKVFTIN